MTAARRHIRGRRSARRRFRMGEQPARMATVEPLEGRLLLAAGPGAGAEMLPFAPAETVDVLRFGPAEIAERLPIGPVFIEAIDPDGAMHIRRGDEAMAIEAGAETVTRLGESWTSASFLAEAYAFAVLRIDGTDGDDVIRIRDTAGGVEVERNGETETHDGFFRRIEAYGYEGHDEIRYDGELPLWAYGGPGDDVLAGGTGSDSLYGEQGDDTLEGGDEFFGMFPLEEVPDVSWFRERGVRGDLLEGGAGNDRIFGGDEQILVLMDLGGMVGTAAPVHSGIPGDEIHGGDGADTIHGGTGDDLIHGDAGRDTIDGESGNDEIHGGDEMLGSYLGYNPGRDWLTAVGFGGDTIRGGYGNDTIYGGDERVDVLAYLGYGMVSTPEYQNVPGDEIDGGPGVDTIRGEGGDDTLEGGSGSDNIRGGLGHDQLDGGVDGDDLGGNEGDDQLYGGRGTDVLCGDEGADFLSGGDEMDYARGGAGIDSMYGGRGDDWLWGGLENDLIKGEDGHDHLFGNDGDDNLYGGMGNDELTGGEGNDRLIGGPWGDWLWGGSGMDALLAWNGWDFVIDGGPGSDRIYVSSAGDAELFSAGEDAAFLVVDGAGGTLSSGDTWTGGSWTDDELDLMDRAVRLLHEINGTDTLIQKSDGTYCTLTRGGTTTRDAAAWNDDGNLVFFDASIGLPRTYVHEFGHNWDTENPRWEEFLEISGWTQEFPGDDTTLLETERYGEVWWYDPSANFAEDYGESHPVEDWATCVEAYFFGDQEGDHPGLPDPAHEWMATNMPLKFALVDEFLRTHRR